MSFISARLNRISPSQTIAMTQKARELRLSGLDILSLSAGEPDFATPAHICEAAIKAVRDGDTHYTDVAGTKRFREAAAARLKADYGLDYASDEIIISTGGKQVIYNVFVATLNAGDEVIIPSPAWVSYPDIVALADGTPIIVPTLERDGFKLTPEALRAALTPRTKWLVLNSPCNPTGAAYSGSELRALADVLASFPDIWILTDDIYAKLVYDGFVAETIAQVAPELRSRTVTMNGLSKAYAMTGWRIGYAAAPAPLIKALTKLQGQSTSNACSIAQAAGVAALTGSHEFLTPMLAEYKARRDLVLTELAKIPGMRCAIPQGAFYVFPAIDSFLGGRTSQGRELLSDDDFVMALLEEKGVATVQGSAFLCPGYFRISYAAHQAVLNQACARIIDFCAEIR